MADANDTQTDPATGGEPGKANAQTGTETGEQTAAQSGTEKKTFTEEDVNRIVQTRLSEEKRKQQEAIEAGKRKAEEERLKQQGEFEKIAAQRQEEIDKIKPKAEAADRYAERLNSIADGIVAAWPEEVKTLDPGSDNLDLRLDWIEKSRPLAERLLALPKAPDTDAGKGNHPAPSGGNGRAPETQTYRFQSAGDVKW